MSENMGYLLLMYGIFVFSVFWLQLKTYTMSLAPQNRYMKSTT